MSKPRMTYFEKDDVLHLAISEEAEVGSVEVSPNITAELNADGVASSSRHWTCHFFRLLFRPRRSIAISYYGTLGSDAHVRHRGL